jgi:hypothetical protein
MVCSTPLPWLPFWLKAVRWCRRKLVLSTFPLPLLPLISMHWHTVICCIHNSKDVWRKFWPQSSVLVQLYIFGVINWITLEQKINIFHLDLYRNYIKLTELNKSKFKSYKTISLHEENTNRIISFVQIQYTLLFFWKIYKASDNVTVAV